MLLQAFVDSSHWLYDEISSPRSLDANLHWVDDGHTRIRLKQVNNVEIERQFPPVSNETAVKVVHLLKACAKHKDLSRGCKLHAYILKHTCLEKNCYIASYLINMYARCGALAKAQQVLNQLPIRNVIMWTALISGYAQQGQSEEALKCFENMQQEGHLPTVVTFTCALKACGSLGAAAKGEQIHEKIVSLGLLKGNIIIGSALVDMYARCGALARAQQVLDELPARNAFTWTALIAGYVQQGQGEEALKCFDSMQCEGQSPDKVTFSCALKACASIKASSRGEKIHDQLASSDILEKDIMLGNTLVDMYAKCGKLEKAQQVFNELPVRDMVTWSALIAGYALQGRGQEALKCFDRMQREGHVPDAVTFACALKACGNVGLMIKGEQIHNKIVSLGMLEKDMVLGSTLVDMYARCGAAAKGHQVHSKLPIRNVVTWTTLMTGYIEQGQGEEALKCFDGMQQEGHTPNLVTFICALKACGSIGATAKGEQIHEKLADVGWLEKNNVLGSTLVDMYVKCAELRKAVDVLDKFSIQDVVAWNALIGGYAQLGQYGKSVTCLERMQSKGIKPDSTSWVCILNACGHSGQLEEAKMYFMSMSTRYGVTPDVEHHSSMVGLFGRAGKLLSALIVIEKIAFTDHLPLWVALLCACSKWEDAKIGKLAFLHALYLDNNSAASYVCMANICMAAEMQEDADRIEVRVRNET